MGDLHNHHELQYYWGSLPHSMFTLFSSVTGGIDWDKAVRALAIISWIWVACFGAFLSFVIFAVLNVMTGVFCQSAIERKQNDPDAMIPLFLANRTKRFEEIRLLFQDLDKECTGFITI